MAESKQQFVSNASTFSHSRDIGPKFHFETKVSNGFH